MPSSISLLRPPAALLDALEAAGASLLRADWDLAASQFDMHSERAGGGNGVLDCGHFCAPSGVAEAFADSIIRAAVRRAA